MSAPLTWVVGAGGLLGKQVSAVVQAKAEVISGPRVPWADPERAQDVLRSTARRVRDAAGTRPWQVIWCAGPGIIGSTPDALRDELAALGATLDGLTGLPNQGAFFLASSVGGVYAGVGSPPYDESSLVRPLSAYGEAKLQAEDLVAQWARRSGGRVLVGRITNLYGPGQNLAKQQGLVSRLCLAHFQRAPVRIWVPLDTRRDYLYVADCAELIVAGMDLLRAAPADGPQPVVVTKVLASGHSMTVGAVIGEVRRIVRRGPSIILSAAPIGAPQVRDLGASSVVWPELDHRSRTPFPVGVLATVSDLRRARQAGTSTAGSPRPDGRAGTRKESGRGA